MTSNQIAAVNARETIRHDLQVEAETKRANSLNYETNRRGQMVQKEIAALNNSTNLAIAQQNQANQRYIAELNAETSRRNAQIAADNALNIAAINADTSRYVSSLNASTSIRTAQMTQNEKYFEANLKHQEYLTSQAESERHNVASETNDRYRSNTSFAGNLLNMAVNAARAALIPLGI